jgi:dihydroorotase-like cyclic amidohydrolase
MKCYPPIRDGREKNLLLLSLKKRYFNAISSNHFPVDPLYKFSVGGNFFKALNGIGTLGFSL